MIDIGQQLPGKMNPSDPHPQREDKHRFNVLFLCHANSVCSVVAEALLKQSGGDDFRAFSAGIEPQGIDPAAADFLRTHRLWHQGLRSKSCAEFLTPNGPHMDFVISVGERPPAGARTSWPGAPRIIHWRISEPITDGTDAAKTISLRKTFSELENRVRLFVLVHQKAAKMAARAA